MPVYQTKYGKENGNCFQACVATLFDLPLDSVPDFCNEEPKNEWWIRYRKWLNKKGLSVVCLSTTEKDLRGEDYKDSLVIVSGLNSDGVRHAIIYLNGQPFFNPNRFCKGICPDTVDIIFLQNPKQGCC